MLPQISLDDARFAGLMERAREQITRIYPEWTDHNGHDPGITILELFAWLTELQQFHLDQAGEEYLLRYLQLLGIRPGTKRPASVLLEFASDLPRYLPKGSRFFAGEICFELAEEVRVGAGRIVRLASCPARGHKKVAEVGDSLYFPAFGEEPAAGSALWIGLDRALLPGVRYRLSFELAPGGVGERNPFDGAEDFCPLAELKLQYQTGEGCRDGTIHTDSTHQLLVDGSLTFSVGPMEAGEEGLYWLRLFVVHCAYDVPPVLTKIHLGLAPALQQRTLAEYHDLAIEGGGIEVSTYLALHGDFALFVEREGAFCPCGARRRVEGDYALFFPEEAVSGICRMVCFEARELAYLGEGDGLPFQEYPAPLSGLCADGLVLMAETEKGSGRFVGYERRLDFAEAGPEDAVFTFREEEGVFRFGDCERGLAPEGMIFLAAARQSLGLGGNVREGQICGTGESGLSVTNRRAAAGGRDAESLDDCKKRLLEQQAAVEQAVTAGDFEEIAKRTPGLIIESARLVPVTRQRRRDGSVPEETVTLVVKPGSWEERPALSEPYRNNILRALEPHRLLGTGIEVLSPEYVGVSVFVELVAKGERREVERELKEALSGYFAGIRGSFGAAVRVSDLYGILDVQGMAEITALSLDAQGEQLRRSRGGDLLLPANGLAYLKEGIFQISAKR